MRRPGRRRAPGRLGDIQPAEHGWRRRPRRVPYALLPALTLLPYAEAVGEHGGLVDDEAGATVPVAVVARLKEANAGVGITRDTAWQAIQLRVPNLIEVGRREELRRISAESPLRRARTLPPSPQ